ncbi:MAG: efflux transporter outer membrane subunit [Desulfobulbus sp.]|nr:efflux transporter outer membrane subunit [Desulfobulbus sp.]
MHKLPVMAVAAALLAGCSFIPGYERPEAPVAQAYPQGDAYTAQPAGAAGRSANGSAATDIGWREFFVDPRLQQLVDIALKNNRNLRVSLLNVEAARAQYQITRAELFPAIGAVGARTRTRTADDMQSAFGNPYTVYNVGLQASWEIDFWGRIRSLKDQALAQYFATAHARQAAEITLVAQVADQYLTLLAADDFMRVTQETLKTAQASYHLVQVKFDAGIGTELDLRQAQSVVETAEASLQAQRRARAQAENALALLIGAPLPADLPQSLPLDGQNLLADIPEGLPSDLLMRRPDIMQAEQMLLAANANIGAARAAFFPKISLTGAYGSQSLAFHDLFKGGSLAWSFAPQISLPIFEGGANVANLELANIKKRIEIANYEKAIQSAFREVADGLAARGTYDQQIKALERNTVANQRALTISELRYQNGVDSYLPVLTAQTNLYAALQALINARLARLTNLVDLYRALGGGWIEHTGETPRAADDMPDTDKGG